MRCGDCKWWTGPRIPEHGPHGLCNLIDSEFDEKEHMAEIRGRDDADLYTVPDFGCVQFEAK